MESTHQNDVVFTRDSLNKFIKLIKTEGIKNLDYYIMSPSIDVKNINGDEFSLGEKTLFSGNIAIVNKSYYTGDPYTKVSLDDNTEEYYKNLRTLRYNIKNVFNFPFNDTTDSVSMYPLKSNIHYYLTQEQFNALSTNPKKASDILIHIESPEESDKYIDANVFKQCPTQVDNFSEFYVATVVDNDKNGMIFITKQITADNYNFTFDKNKEASFGYALDSSIVSGANNFMNYLFLEKDENNNYQYYTIDDSNKIDFTKYNQTINAPYEFSIVQDPNDKTQQVVRKFDGQTLFSNTDVAEQAETIGRDDDLTASNNLYYQGLKKVKYDKFLDETHPNDGTELNDQNVDIFIDSPSVSGRSRKYNTNLDLGIYPCFKSDDPLLQAFQKETINDIEEMTYTGTKASNYYQIFWDSTSDHLLHDIKISYGYKENGAASDSSNVQLMYNYTIPVRSIKIKSWEQLNLNNKTRVFPNIENKNYSAPYDNMKHIIGKWQPNDLVNLFGAYQVLKGREADVEEVEDIRAFTTGDATTSGTSNAHQIAFTPNNFENAIINKNVYEHLSSSTAENINYDNYNEFEYIVLDNVSRTYNFNTTIKAGDLPFGKKIESDNDNNDTGKTITSAINNNGKIYYYDASSGRGSTDTTQPAPPAVDSLSTSKYVKFFNSLKESQIGSPYSIISLPTVNTHKDRTYGTDAVYGWDMKYVPVLSDVHAFILTTTSTNSQLDEIETNINFNFQPFTVTTATWANMVESSANINITIEYIIRTDKINTQTRIPIYVLPLDSAEFTTANSKYNGKILDKDNKYYGLFMTNQTKNESKTIDGNQYKKYYLIGYLPQTYFWETDLLERSMTSKDNSEECAKSWQILLQDRLNNSINSSLFHDNINTRFIDLHKDLNIFDIVLSSSTKSDGTAIPTSTNGFYEGDLGFYYKEDVNTSREGLYRLQYNPNVIDSETTYYFSNYTNFDVNLINRYPNNIITFQSTTGTNNDIYTAKYTKVDDAASLINTWENDKLYGTISTTAEPKTTSAYSAIKDTDYFLYTRNSNVVNDYKEIDRTLNITLNSFSYDAKDTTETYASNQYYYKDGDQYKLSTTPYPDSNINYYKVIEKALVVSSLNTLVQEQKLYYKKICDIGNSYDIHPSLLNGISSTTDTNAFSLSYYKPISLRPYEANKYQYYAQLLNLNNSTNFATFLGNVVSANIPVYYRDETYTLVDSNAVYDKEGKFYYQFKSFVQIEGIGSSSYNNKKNELHGNMYYLNNDIYAQVKDNDSFVENRIYYTKNYELLDIVDEEDFKFYKSLLNNNLYSKTRKYTLLEIPENTENLAELYNYKYTYYLQQLDSSEAFSTDRDYYYNDDNDPDLELIINFYQPNTYYYYNGVNFILDDNSNMNSNYQYYQLVTLKNLEEQQILDRLNNRFYNNEGYVTTLEYANNTWYYYPKGNSDDDTNNRQSMVNNEGKILFPGNDQYDQLIYIYNNETSFLYTEDIDTIPYNAETGRIKVLILYYTYQPIDSDDVSYYIIHTDNSTYTINLLFKYPIFIKQDSDQDELYTKVNPLDKIILDPAAGMEYYIKEYDKDDTATSTIGNYTKTDNTIESITSYDSNLLLMYLNQELGLKKYYNWNYESRRGKECDGTFTVELAKNPYVCASKVGWYWTYGVDEKAEALNSISFSTSTTPTNANNVAKMITPFYDYMNKSESDKIFTADSYNTTNKYEGFTTAVTMQITDKTRIANTVSISNQVSSQTISTVNSATNTPSVYMLHKLLNRRNSFNIDYTTNYDYIHGRSNLNSTAGHSDLGAPYQFRTYAQIKDINFFDLENQFQIFYTDASSSTAAASLSTSRGSTNARYLHVGTSDNDTLDFDQFSVYSTTAYTTTTGTTANGTIPKLVEVLNDKLNFFTSHQYREAKIIKNNNNFNSYKDFLYYYDTTDNTIKQVESDASYSSTTKYYFKYDDNKPFNAESMVIRYLDDKKEHSSINPSKDSNSNLVHQRDNTNIPCFNKDAWLLLQAHRTSWNETIGDLDYLYLTPEKYYINNQIVYIYFIYQLHYEANAVLTKININPNCCIYYIQTGIDYDNQPIYKYNYSIINNNKLNIKTYTFTLRGRTWISSSTDTDITKICHLKDPFYELHIGLPKIYQAYFQAIEYWYKNPYPGGAPVFFEDWCKSGKNLKSTRNAKETETRNYYYYGIKLPKDLLIEKSDQYYQYKYSFDIVKNDDNTSLFTTSNNHYLVTYRLVEDYLPQTSYDNTTETNIDRGFKDPEDSGYTIPDFTKALANMLSKQDETEKPYEYYILESTSESLTIDDHNKIFDGNAIVLSDIKFKFYTNSNNTFEKSVYIKLSDTKLEDESNITFDSIKGKYYQYNEDNGYSNYELTPSEVKVALNYKVWISDHNPDEDEFAKYQLYKYTQNDSIDDILEINTPGLEEYIYSTTAISAAGFVNNKNKDSLINDNGKYKLNISIPFKSTTANTLYLENFENNLGFRHVFLNIPNKKYTNSFTADNPYPNQAYYLDSNGCLKDSNGNDTSPNGTFSISSGTLNPGVLVQVRGFNNDGEYEGDLNGGTLKNVTFGEGILHVKDTTDAWRKPIIDIINAKLNVKPKNQGGNIYASIVTEGGISAAKKIKGERLYGAIWNDYAEYRQTDAIEPGRCVIETGTGELKISTGRLQGGANITSDTFGMGVGETDLAKTPIAVSGRVLAYPYEDRNIFKPGDAVCSGPNGTVSIMSREEIKEWPDRIVGYVSEIPYYETWGTGNVKVNGRIWIKIH